MTKAIAIIVLAAGKGTRMKSSMPKVMHKVAGKTLISYAMQSVCAILPKSVTLVIGEGMDEVVKEASHAFPSVSAVVQKNRLGTADAVKSAINGNSELNNFNGTIIVIYGDHPFIKPQTLSIMIEKLQKRNNASVVVLGFNPENPGEYGRLVINKDGELDKIVESRDANEEQKKINFCNSGVMAIRGRILPDLLKEVKNNNAKKEYYLTDIVAIARDRNLRCFVAEASEREVMGINSQKERTLAEKTAQEELRDRALENGAVLIAPETVFLSDDTEIGEGAIIHPYVVFGPGAKIEAEAVIKSFSHIEGALIKKSATVGPFARLRPGAEVGSKAKIGNFVEIKESVIGDGAKISHLTYIGNAEIGDEANIGAGTVTCNYDGYHKYKTEIGENAFIGSNSSLVAPVKIGKGAIIGAGSTITKDVEDDAMAFSNAKQKNMPDRAAIYKKEKKSNKK